MNLFVELIIYIAFTFLGGFTVGFAISFFDFIKEKHVRIFTLESDIKKYKKIIEEQLLLIATTYQSRNKEVSAENSNVKFTTIKYLTNDQIPLIVDAFIKYNWLKEESVFQRYLVEQQLDQRIIWVAYYKGQIAGYVTLKWNSLYKPFFDAKIPEISDLNVLPPFRKSGIGARLLEIAEGKALTQSNLVGVGVGLYSDYGAAQKLYVKRGYVPDNFGATYNYIPVQRGNTTCMDDDLALWFIKKFN